MEQKVILDSKRKFKVKGIVAEVLPGTKFRVKIDISGETHEIIYQAR
jgi:translation initiation factor IF-1